MLRPVPAVGVATVVAANGLSAAQRDYDQARLSVFPGVIPRRRRAVARTDVQALQNDWSQGRDHPASAAIGDQQRQQDEDGDPDRGHQSWICFAREQGLELGRPGAEDDAMTTGTE